MYNITKRKVRISAIFNEMSGWVHDTDVNPSFYIEPVLILP
jgi:hypothetical protein